ncbi:energy-coupled thiamine transporter ThiT [Virgibacillus chiguensis]|uniref:Thiamine transporter n=1 Tax=Virgibacillus chiguensis TaxID=411959 RepID=A0A1M5QIP2_9BACI|nr:energy-coupled thiamine transporter ThiT [Virgibacillus chiguensis]SHH13659.1 thiamine transporter [Virgibacillus chiguensis]
MKNIRLLVMVEAAFFAAFAMILDFLPSIKLSPAISISFAMVPIFILAFRRGMLAGILAGFLWGLLQVMLGDATILTPTQFLIEYFIAFASVGFAGLLSPFIQKSFANGRKKVALTWGVAAVFVGSMARYFWHFLAGVIFWGDYAPKGTSPLVYSFIANGTTFVGAFVFCAIVLAVILASAPRLVQAETVTLKNLKKAS